MSKDTGQSDEQEIQPDSLKDLSQEDMADSMPYLISEMAKTRSSASPCSLPEPLDEEVFEYKESQKYLLPYLRAIKEVADLYHQEYARKTYTDGSWQFKSITSLNHASIHLGVLIRFLENPENLQLATDTLGAVLRAGKRYAELLGPVMVSFGVVVILEWSDTRHHRRKLRTLTVDLDEIDSHLKYLEFNLPLVAELLNQAGLNLENMLQHRSQPALFNSESKTLEDKFIRMHAEFIIAEDHLRRVDSLIVRLDTQLQAYRIQSLLQYGLLMVAGSGLGGLLKSKEILDTKTMLVLMASSTAPLLYFYFFLSVDIQDMLTEVRKKERHMIALGLELSALHRRLRVLKASRTLSPQQDRDVVDSFALHEG